MILVNILVLFVLKLERGYMVFVFGFWVNFSFLVNILNVIYLLYLLIVEGVEFGFVVYVFYKLYFINKVIYIYCEVGKVNKVRTCFF